VSLNGPAPTLVYALTRIVYNVLCNNPGTLTLNVLVLTNNVVLLTLYCNSYSKMTPLGVSGGSHDKKRNVDWITVAVKECGAVGPETIG